MEIWPVDPAASVAPYEQLRAQLAGRVASGELESGTRLPTVRALAADLGLAVNTVARAYRELEADGVVVTEGRRGTFVKASFAGSSTGSSAGSTAGSSTGSSAATRETADEAAAAYALSARRLGLTLPEATRLLERAWPT